MLDILVALIAMGSGGGGDAAPEAATQALVAEEQVATGKFLTALEVKPILTATKGSWVAVRDYDGQDLVYVTHLWAWRCGLVQIEMAVNGGAFEVWPMPDCHVDSPTPGAITESDGLPYRSYAAGSVQQLDVRITYDDLSADTISVARQAVLMP
ncbi:hypothetical protein JQX09_20145 [Sulfitobacter pseudonitzschiae]|uniref:Uncharacterized protein n=1 Tax=Pseudosulfitobacter pseudonitzschiae TaxID=1402135 RepID=A0A9Q2RX96_9RHOB|nr:hypothetical protein [Pseudosulfitobacter pseudonitzschiae]MBM2294243.1 hypothetical protein [Pseudosulfitobacter pseudonitzschiae]MBM2299167.1 hypothetical protein [Pseudosulfitobacter pseudonitzschiae]MBM2304075.1 hypothetical protein [Pseudosulfitobacter pseudonitzschiae]MBM2313856.1 hypothetical protein [Pseudosulfitobacter pseudonitzschiae]MBM2318770.1 hypothetical protein [Pseudosulfitobacter pseudonitzschiae]